MLSEFTEVTQICDTKNLFILHIFILYRIIPLLYFVRLKRVGCGMRVIRKHRLGMHEAREA